MKKHLFALLLIFSYTLNAQKTSLTFTDIRPSLESPYYQSPETIHRIGQSQYRILIDSKGSQMAFTFKLNRIKYTLSVAKYDLNMKEIKTISFNESDTIVGPFSPQTTIFNNKIVIVYYSVQTNGSIKLLMSIVDPETLLKQTSELYTISEKNVGMFKASEALNQNDLRLCFSPDHTTLLIAQSGNTNEVFTCILQKDMKIKDAHISVSQGLENFSAKSCQLDNSGNRYLSYSYKEEKLEKNGVLIVNNQNKEKYFTISTGENSTMASTTWIKISRDNRQVYAYASYTAADKQKSFKGVLIAALNAGQLKADGVQLYPFPQNIMKSMDDEGFGYKSKGEYYITPMDYLLNELEDGTIALTGNPVKHVVSNDNRLEYYANGPIVNIFIKNKSARFNLVYRDQLRKDYDIIVTSYKNDLLCIYNDTQSSMESNAENAPRSKNVFGGNNNVLAQAIIKSDGTFFSKKIIGEKIKGLSYLMEYHEVVDSNTFLIPCGEYKVKMSGGYNTYEKWGLLKIE